MRQKAKGKKAKQAQKRGGAAGAAGAGAAADSIRHGEQKSSVGLVCVRAHTQTDETKRFPGWAATRAHAPEPPIC